MSRIVPSTRRENCRPGTLRHACTLSTLGPIVHVVREDDQAKDAMLMQWLVWPSTAFLSAKRKCENDEGEVQKYIGELELCTEANERFAERNERARPGASVRALTFTHSRRTLCQTFCLFTVIYLAMTLRVLTGDWYFHPFFFIVIGRERSRWKASGSHYSFLGSFFFFFFFFFCLKKKVCVDACKKKL